MLFSDIHVHRIRQKKRYFGPMSIMFFYKNMILKGPKYLYLTLCMYNKSIVAEHHSFETHRPYTCIQRNVIYLDAGMFNLNLYQ